MLPIPPSDYNVKMFIIEKSCLGLQQGSIPKGSPTGTADGSSAGRITSQAKCSMWPKTWDVHDYCGHSFIQQSLFEYVIYVKDSTRQWGDTDDQNSQHVLCPNWTYSL